MVNASIYHGSHSTPDHSPQVLTNGCVCDRWSYNWLHGSNEYC